MLLKNVMSIIDRPIEIRCYLMGEYVRSYNYQDGNHIPTNLQNREIMNIQADGELTNIMIINIII